MRAGLELRLPVRVTCLLCMVFAPLGLLAHALAKAATSAGRADGDTVTYRF
jgi:hypothetical protein